MQKLYIKTLNISPVLNIESILFNFNNFIDSLKLGKSHYIYLLIKLSGKNDEEHEVIFSFTNRIVLNINDEVDINLYKKILNEKFNKLDQYYLQINLENIHFNYTILTLEQYNHLKNFQNKNKELIHLKKENLIKKLTYPKLPNTLDKNNSLFKDKWLSKGLFKRTLDNGLQLFYYKNTVELLLRPINAIKFMTTSITHSFLNIKYMTLDIETYVKDGQHIPYCISTYYEENKQGINQSFINNNLFDDLLKYLLNSKFDKYIIYIHNSSHFDMIFLLKILLQNDKIIKVNPIIKDGKFINLEVIFNINGSKYKITFRDSYLLLPSSLSKLSIAFSNTFVKGIFPYNFVKDFNLDYEGNVPDYHYFDNTKVTLEQYSEYKNEFNNNWNLMIETIKYCELDCKSLFEVIKSFQNEIYSLFKIDITKCPTLPSLAFKIFKTHYLNKNEIPIINTGLYKILSQAYYGGHVDMYIPEGPIDKVTSLIKNGIKKIESLIYHYDVNSLYPSAMRYLQFPTGKITYFIPRNNDSLNLIPKELDSGIYRVNITSPKNILHPLIPIKIKGACVYPVGTWQGWYFKDELVNAKKFGYTYEILEGYLFESKPIFKDYIDKLYEMKVNSEPNSPKYIISKLLMNSLYGRFAMNPHLLNYKIVEGIDNNTLYEDLIEITPNKYLISYYDENQSYGMQINIAIGLAITAYARIIMSKFKNNIELIGNLFYSDTDSILCDKPLPTEFVGVELGQLKLEQMLTNFISLGPKVYGGIRTDGSSFTKVKGLKNKISFNDLIELLNQNNNIEFTQEKWFKSLIEGTINIKESPYILKPTENKRELIYKDNKLIGTSSIILNNGLRINSHDK